MLIILKKWIEQYNIMKPLILIFMIFLNLKTLNDAT